MSIDEQGFDGTSGGGNGSENEPAAASAYNGTDLTGTTWRLKESVRSIESVGSVDIK